MRQVFKTGDRLVEPGSAHADKGCVPVASTQRFRDGRIAGFLAVESGHLALAGPVTSGVNVVCFRDAMPLTLRWSVSGSALGRGVPHGNRLTADRQRIGINHPGCSQSVSVSSLASQPGKPRGSGEVKPIPSRNEVITHEVESAGPAGTGQGVRGSYWWQRGRCDGCPERGPSRGTGIGSIRWCRYGCNLHPRQHDHGTNGHHDDAACGSRDVRRGAAGQGAALRRRR